MWKTALSFKAWIRRTLVVAVIVGGATIALCWDQNLLGAFHPKRLALLRASSAEPRPALGDEGPMPELGGAVAWLNSAPCWQAFHNEYWPADYFIDGKGRIRHHHFGEGEYGESELVIQQLLKENGATGLTGSTVSVTAGEVEAAPDFANSRSPETYIGYQRAKHLASPEPLAKDSQRAYSSPAKLSLNEWVLSGSWSVGVEAALLQAANGKIVFRFHSRDLHMVLDPTKDGKPVRYRVKLDGAAPNDDRGTDSAPDGTGEVREPRLYQFIRQKGQVGDRTF